MPHDPSASAAASAAAALRSAVADADAALANGGSGALADFDRLRARRAGDEARHTDRAARAPANRARNRYTDVLPFDATRVVLPPGPCPQADAHDYINASVVASRPGEAPAWHYVAAQGPLPHTVPDFWRMAHSMRSPAIVSLTPAVEGGVAKCAVYLPQEGEGSAGDAVAVFGSYRVTLVGPPTRGDGGVVLRRVSVAPAVDGGSVDPTPHVLTHIHIPDWPDHGVLASTATLRGAAAALRFAVGGGDAAATAPPPPIIHCSAGIGRTGTLLAVDIAVRRLHVAAGGGPAARDAAARALALRRLVRRLRCARPGMVQTPAQYVAALAAVRDEAASLAEEVERVAAGEAAPMLGGVSGGEGGSGPSSSG